MNDEGMNPGRRMVLVVVDGVKIPATEFYCSDCRMWFSTVQPHAYHVRSFNKENRLARRARTVHL